MEQNSKESKQSNWKKVFQNIIIAFAVIIIIVIGFTKLLNRNQELSAELQKEKLENVTCVSKRDSLDKAVVRLSIYKSLTLSMVHRDEARKTLKYQIGEFVYLKRDSSHVLVSDIVIGGSAYEYYMRYKVMYKNGSTEEVLPELVY